MAGRGVRPLPQQGGPPGLIDTNSRTLPIGGVEAVISEVGQSVAWWRGRTVFFDIFARALKSFLDSITNLYLERPRNLMLTQVFMVTA